jgi:hypothetical protein
MDCDDFHGSVNNRFIIVVGSRQHNSTIDASRSEYCGLATPFEAIAWGATNPILKRFSSSRGVYQVVQGGLYFHPRDKDPSPGTPQRKRPLRSCGLPLQQLENRYKHLLPAEPKQDRPCRVISWRHFSVRKEGMRLDEACASLHAFIFPHTALLLFIYFCIAFNVLFVLLI